MQVTVIEIKCFPDGNFEELKRYDVTVKSARGLRMLCLHRGIKNANFVYGKFNVGYVRELNGELYFSL